MARTIRRTRIYRRSRQMIRTRIYLVDDLNFDVQESYQEVKDKMTTSQDETFIELTLENGDPVTLQRTQIVCFLKF